MNSYDARSKFEKIDDNPSLGTASSEYDKLYSLMYEVIDALQECETERDNAENRVHDIESELSDANDRIDNLTGVLDRADDRIAELERQIEEPSSKENS